MSEQKPDFNKLAKLGGVIGEHKSPFRIFADTFFAEDLPTVRKHIYVDVIKPQIRDFMANTFISFVQRMFYGGGTVPTQQSYIQNKRNMPSYAAYYQRNAVQTQQKAEPDPNNGAFYNRVYATRGDALKAYAALKAAIAEYGNVSISEYVHAATEGEEESTNFADNYHGWTELPEEPPIRRVSTGHLLDLPKPVTLR